MAASSVGVTAATANLVTAARRISANPVPVQGLASGVAQIAAGDYHTCAVKTSGAVLCWGDNDSGQLGNDSTTNSSTPVAVTGLSSGVVAIAAGGYHTCALTSVGGVKCWGDDGNGQLGDGGDTSESTPVNVSGLSSGVASIAAGESHTCAVTTSNGAKCWGYDGYGELGNGTTNDYHVPKAVSGLASTAAQLDLGANHTCAVTTSGAAECWGFEPNENFKVNLTKISGTAGATIENDDRHGHHRQRRLAMGALPRQRDSRVFVGIAGDRPESSQTVGRLSGGRGRRAAVPRCRYRSRSRAVQRRRGGWR